MIAPGARVAVLGGAGGIGRAVVARLLAAQATVAVLDLPESLARHNQPGTREIPCDATDLEALEAAFAAIGRLDGLVVLAGFTEARTPVSETTEATFRAVLDGNLTTTFLACRAALPWLRLGQQPAIVTMASGLALKPTPGYGPYSAAKAGVLALTRLLAAENAPEIRVNAVAPAAVDTAFLRGGTHRGGDDATATRLDLDAYVRTVPLGRLAVPDDIAGPILFLLSAHAGYITGQTLHINGGLLMP
jgi:3-oxoacyl-[acyl-carrier protein] reductase